MSKCGRTRHLPGDEDIPRRSAASLYPAVEEPLHVGGDTLVRIVRAATDVPEVMTRGLQA